MYAKYEVSMSNPVPGARCAQTTTQDANGDARLPIHDCKDSLVDKPNEPKIETNTRSLIP